MKQRIVFTKVKRIFLFVFLLLLVSVGFSACKNSVDYFEYVSELRSNLFLASADGFSLRIYSVAKEMPYISDGIPQESSMRTEIYLSSPEGNENCSISFLFQENTYGGDMSYDNVRGEYYFFCSLDVSAAQELHCTLSYGKEEVTLCAQSVVSDDTLTPKNVLKIIETDNRELFDGLTDKYGFKGEIYIRLIYEDAPYYYVGVIERTKVTHAFLVNAKTGKILAKRDS